MAKTFITERDIEDMARRGEMNLVVDEDTVLTDLAYEKTRRLKVQLIQEAESPPAAPVRPYLSKPLSAAKPAAVPAGSARLQEVKARVKAAVKAQLGNAVDDALLDRIIDRVAAELGLA